MMLDLPTPSSPQMHMRTVWRLEALLLLGDETFAGGHAYLLPWRVQAVMADAQT